MLLIHIIIFSILTGFIGGFLFLIIYIIKNRLLKTGKLTKRLNKQINYVFIGLLCVIWVILFCFRNYRTPSNENLENISNVKLPSNYKVIRDEYDDMLQDYCIYYDIQLDSKSSKDFIKSIKSSKFYNAHYFHQGAWNDSVLIHVDSVKAAWIKSPKGYDFGKPDGRTTCFITFDTLTYKLSYQECYD